MRARIDWKYALGLELADPGFDDSVLCEFRARLVEGGAEERLLGRLLERCRELGLLKARGRQRSDTTHVLAAIRALNRLELVGEIPRAALNELATVVPDWLREVAPKGLARALRPPGRGRSPATHRGRARGLRATVGEDGFALLDRLDGPGTPEDPTPVCSALEVLRRVWERHFARDGTLPPGAVRFRPKEELPAT